MVIDILTTFVDMVQKPLTESIVGRAVKRSLVRINVVDLRRFAHDRHQMTDDYPYGGGQGMVMKPEPIFEAVDYLKQSHGSDDTKVVLLCPQGEVFTQKKAQTMVCSSHVIMICGHYEGVDDRVRSIVTDEISIGDYVLTGGELPALVITDAIVRLLPGVLGDADSHRRDSFSQDTLLEGPQYTRPAEYRGMSVPHILLSGDHERIKRWRRQQSLLRTKQRRSELLAEANLTDEDREFLTESDTYRQ